MVDRRLLIPSAIGADGAHEEGEAEWRSGRESGERVRYDDLIDGEPFLALVDRR